MNYLVIKEYDTKIRFELTIQNTVNVVKIIICEKHGKSNGLYIPEKTNSGRLRIWNFQKIEGVIKKNYVEFPGILDSRLKFSEESNSQFCGFSRVEALFCLEFPGVKKKT